MSEEKLPTEEEVYERELRESVKTVLSTPAGAFLMKDLFTDAMLFRTICSGDARQDAFCEGKRDLGLKYLDLIAVVCPEKIAELLIKARE